MQNKKIFKVISMIALVAIAFLLSTEVMEAQCPMCRMAAESNLKDGGTAGKGLNGGILYMLATPYLVVGTIAFVWWRNKKKDKVEE